MNFDIRLLKFSVYKKKLVVNARQEPGEEPDEGTASVPTLDSRRFPLYKRRKDLGLMIVFILSTREHSKHVVDNLTVLIYKVGIFTVFTVSVLFRGLR